MAQTGFTPIEIYGSGTTGNTPSASNLVTSSSGCELAINYTDGKLFYKDNNGVVQVLATKAGTSGIFTNVTITGGTIDGTTIGATTPTTGKFSTLTATTSNLGTVSTGTWNGSTIGTGYGGTGITTTPANGALLIGNGTGYTSATLTAGTGIAITNSSGGITIAVNGTGEVTSFQTSLSGLTPSTATAGAVTLAGTLGTSSGGTGLTAFTANQIFYASSTSAIAQSSNLTFNGTTLTANTLNLTNALGVSYGGTGLTTLTSGYIPYGNGTSAFSSSSSLTYDGATLTVGASSAFPLTGSKVSIGNDANSALRLSLSNQNAGASALVGIDLEPAGGAWKIDTPSDTVGFAPPLYFKAGASTRLTLTYAGYLGIGTSSPSSILDAVGTIRATSQTAPSSGNGMELFYDTGGNVGYLIAYNRTGSAYRQMNFGSSLYSFGINGSAAMTLDSSGNLGLGVTPSAWSGKAFETPAGGILGYSTSSMNMTQNAYFNGTNWIYKNTAAATYYGQGASGAGQHAWYTAPSGTAGNAITFTQAMTLDNSGNLLVGTTTTTPSSGIGARILATGYISSTLSGSTNATDTLDVYSTGASAYRFYVDMAGTVHATSIVITAISDQRLKENIRDLDTGLSTVMALKPRRFDWKEGKGQDKKNAVGFIAQEFQEVLPNSISTFKAGEDGINYLTMNHEELIPTLVKAIQEQQAIIEQLKAKVGI